MNKILLRKKLERNATLDGVVNGVAYTGRLIEYFGFFENFIVDVSTLNIPKEKVALLKDHRSDIVIGHAIATKSDKEVLIDGKLSKKIKEAQDIISLAEDEFDWEMSVGVYDGYIEEGFSGSVNGNEVENANVLRNGVLREVSIVALGADMDTKVNILNQKSGGDLMDPKLKKRLTKALKLDISAEIEEAVTEVEKIAEEVEAHAQEVEGVKAEVDEKDALIKELQAKIEELEAAIAAINDESEEEARVEEIEASLKTKGITLSKEEIKGFAKTKEMTDMFISTVGKMGVKGKISAEMCEKKVFPNDPEGKSKDLRAEANELVRLGKAKDFLTAINILTGAK